MRSAIPIPAWLLLAAGVAAWPAAAQEVHKCMQKNGQLAYQDRPCAADAKDAGSVNGGYAAPVSGSGTAASHYENYTRMMERDHARQQAERRALEADDHRRDAEPRVEQADQTDYRRHICQAQLDTELSKHRYAAFSCDAQGNKVPAAAPAVVVEPVVIPARRR
jgi:hypothetical protein